MASTVNWATFTDWLGSVMGMQQFWQIAFHTSDIDPTRQTGSGLKSIVMWDEEGGIKFANNEPAAPFFDRSQIQIYLDDFGGPGVQHAAFGVADIMTAVPELRERGVEFLYTPPNYYDASPIGQHDAQRPHGVHHSFDGY